jgi:hypothetical protein
MTADCWTRATAKPRDFNPDGARGRGHFCIKAGNINKEIATKLAISEETVKCHLSNIYAKQGVSSRLELGIALRGL